MNNPESAFPSTFRSMHPEEAQVHRWGMTLRDYFAAKAMAMYFQGPDANEIVGDPDAIAAWCYIMADSMLKAREA
jgi:hypothetical protein